MKTTDIGRMGEKQAERYLKKKGYRIVAKNSHHSHNELDMIVKDRTYIVFVEVKARSVDEDLYSPYGRPAAAVDRAKQRRTISAARSYLSGHPNEGLQPRFDVIEVYFSKDLKRILHIHHISNAFGIS